MSKPEITPAMIGRLQFFRSDENVALPFVEDTGKATGGLVATRFELVEHRLYSCPHVLLSGFGCAGGFLEIGDRHVNSAWVEWAYILPFQGTTLRSMKRMRRSKR